MGHPCGALLCVDGGPAGLLPHRRLVPPEGDQEVPQARVQDGLPGRPRHGHQEAGDDDDALCPAVPGPGAPGQTLNVRGQQL